MTRHAILQVSLDFTVSACKSDDASEFFTPRIKEHGLPKDAELVAICHPAYGSASSQYNFSPLHQIGLVVYSASFEDIPVGQPLPILDASVFVQQHWEINVLKEAAQTP